MGPSSSSCLLSADMGCLYRRLEDQVRWGGLGCDLINLSSIALRLHASCLCCRPSCSLLSLLQSLILPPFCAAVGCPPPSRRSFLSLGAIYHSCPSHPQTQRWPQPQTQTRTLTRPQHSSPGSLPRIPPPSPLPSGRPPRQTPPRPPIHRICPPRFLGSPYLLTSSSHQTPCTTPVVCVGTGARGFASLKGRREALAGVRLRGRMRVPAASRTECSTRLRCAPLQWDDIVPFLARSCCPMRCPSVRMLPRLGRPLRHSVLLPAPETILRLHYSLSSSQARL